ncbi:MAG: hypothetical protein KBB14_09415, partial [Thermoanaerobaculia bacterium]|nr:hypothetical protein [Thermoanaerobaculia bacterium]
MLLLISSMRDSVLLKRPIGPGQCTAKRAAEKARAAPKGRPERRLRFGGADRCQLSEKVYVAEAVWLAPPHEGVSVAVTV